MDWERLRRLFGRAGDVNESFEEMFGRSYMDHPDDSKENIPDELIGQDVFNVTNLVERAITEAAEINCHINQSLLLKHLISYMEGASLLSWEESWQTSKHMLTCPNTKCRYLDKIAIMDKLLTPEDMKAMYGSEIRSWEIGQV